MYVYICIYVCICVYIYRPPRMAAVHYEEEKGAGRRERQKVSLIYIAYKIYIYCILYQV